MMMTLSCAWDICSYIAIVMYDLLLYTCRDSGVVKGKCLGRNVSIQLLCFSHLPKCLVHPVKSMYSNKTVKYCIKRLSSPPAN